MNGANRLPLAKTHHQLLPVLHGAQRETIWVRVFHHLLAFQKEHVRFLIVLHTAGAAFTKHLVHLYAYNGPNDTHQFREVSWEISTCMSNK